MIGHVAEPRLALANPLLAQNPLGGFADDAEHALHRIIRAEHRGIGDVEIDRLQRAATVDLERPVLGEHRFGVLPHTAQQRFEVVPELGPVLSRRLPKSARMFQPDGGGIGVIVEGHIIWAPEQDDLGLRAEHQGNRRAQGERPFAKRPERGRRPVQLGNQPPHVPAQRDRT